MNQQSKKVFIESSFFVSFIDRTDFNHLKTTAVFEYLGKNEFQLYTSLQVVTSAFGFIEKNLSVSIAREFLKVMLETDIQIIYPYHPEVNSTYKFIISNPQHKSSVSEILNSALMDRNNIKYVLTHDFWHNSFGTSVSSLLTT